jgi:hypothetical protein
VREHPYPRNVLYSSLTTVAARQRRETESANRTVSSFTKRVVRLTLLRDVHTCAGEEEREDELAWEAFMPEEIEERGGMIDSPSRNFRISLFLTRQAPWMVAADWETFWTSKKWRERWRGTTSDS